MGSDPDARVLHFQVRSAEGIQLPWNDGDRVTDFDVARDMLHAWPDPPGPQVLRVTCRPPESAPPWAGDWWMEPGASFQRLPPARWDSSESAIAWTSGRAWVDAWEECPNALWMLRALPASIPRKGLVRAVCQIVRAVLPREFEYDPAPRCAVEAAEAWVDGRTTEAQVSVAGRAALALAYDAVQRTPSDTLSLHVQNFWSGLGLAAGTLTRVVSDDPFTSYAANVALYAAACAHVSAEEFLRLAAAHVRAALPLPVVLRSVAEPPALSTATQRSDSEG